MGNLARELHLIQVGHLDPEIYEIVELINKYEFSADFFNWLCEGNYIQKTLQEKFEEGKFIKAIHHLHQASLIFTGRGEFYLSQFTKAEIQELTDPKKMIYSTHPLFLNLKKERFCKVASETSYSMISHLYNKGVIAGTVWEIYELKPILRLYQQMNDPLRHWRQSW